MKTMIDLEGAGTLVTNTKKLLDDALTAHNSDPTAHSGTTISSGFQIAIGDTQPVNAALWFDTSDFVSIQGETPTRIITIDDTENPVVRGNTRPSETGVFWWNTSNYGGGSD